MKTAHYRSTLTWPKQTKQPYQLYQLYQPVIRHGKGNVITTHCQLYPHFHFRFMISMHQTQGQPVKMTPAYMPVAND